MLLRRLQQCVSRVCWSHPAASDFGRQAGARLFRMAAPACQAFAVMTTRDEHLELNIAGLKSPIRLNYMWLRDHCYCEKCYSRDTFQKKFDTHSLEKSVVPDEIFLEDETLCLLWPDGHRTTFQLGWLLQNSYDGHRQVKDVTKVLWDANHIKQLNPAMVPHRMFMDTQDGLKQLLLNINTYGFGIVDSVPATEEATGAVAERVCRMHENIYGKLWSFSTDMTHSDTAYTNLALGAHTDNTYLEDCPGIQIFHCLQHDGNGGETLLVDGFNAADQLRKTNREAFEVLCESCVSSEFIDARGEEKLHHMHRTDSILQVNAITNELARIRYNLYDMAPLTSIPPEKVSLFYASLSALTSLLRDHASEHWLKLKPGMVLFVDNWRVLHGRSSYTGKRRMCGAYLSRDDYMSRARVLGLL